MTAGTGRLEAYEPAAAAVPGSEALPDRPPISTPPSLQPRDVRDAERGAAARQPALGFAGLLLVAPVAVLLELVLEALDLLRERRLRDEQLLGGARERPFVRDRDQVVQLSKVHGMVNKAIGAAYQPANEGVFALWPATGDSPDHGRHLDQPSSR
jgi:hypothetical protein